jgi:hypothetical protein
MWTKSGDLRFEHGWAGGRLIDLSRSECLALLAGEEIGRVVYCDRQGPLAVPVNFGLDEETIVFRTAPDNSLATHLRESATCAFEVDRIDTTTRSGWSVVVRGSAALVRHPGPAFDLTGPVPWPEGTRQFVIRITPLEMTGRRLVSPAAEHDGSPREAPWAAPRR